MAQLDTIIFNNPKLWDEYRGDIPIFLNACVVRGRITKEIALSVLEEEKITYTALPEETELSEAQREAVGSALFGKIRTYFTVAFEAAINSIFLASKKPYEFIGGIIGEAWRKSLVKITACVPDDETFLKTLPPKVKEQLLRFKTDPNFWDGAGILVYSMFFAIGRLSALIPVMTADAKRQLNVDISPEIPDIGTLLSVYFRYDGDREQVIRKARELGYDMKDLDLFVKALHVLLMPDDIRQLFLRGIIDEKTHDYMLYQQSYNTKQIDQLKALYQLLPSATDLISMAVREAWDESFAAKWGSDLDYPVPFEQTAKKTGLSPEWCKKYWRAHWQLPSVQMGFEMFQRGFITKDELKGLMKALDIMPLWREKLINIGYRVLSRVDVRRMYDVGVLDRDGVKKAYLDLGYNEYDAELMTEFTIRYVTDTEKDLAKGDILSAYQRRLIGVDLAISLLTDMGYDIGESSILLARVDYDLEKKRKDTVLANIKKAYVKQVLSANDVRLRLSAEGFVRTEIDQYIADWTLEIKDDIKTLTRSDYDKLFKAKKIKEDEYRTALAVLRYTQHSIDLLVSLNK